jgi:hypothetical protein
MPHGEYYKNWWGESSANSVSTEIFIFNIYLKKTSSRARLELTKDKVEFLIVSKCTQKYFAICDEINYDLDLLYSFF